MQNFFCSGDNPERGHFPIWHMFWWVEYSHLGEIRFYFLLHLQGREWRHILHMGHKWEKINKKWLHKMDSHPGLRLPVDCSVYTCLDKDPCNKQPNLIVTLLYWQEVFIVLDLGWVSLEITIIPFENKYSVMKWKHIIIHINPHERLTAPGRMDVYWYNRLHACIVGIASPYQIHNWLGVFTTARPCSVIVL